MLINEILIESTVGRIHIGDLKILVDDHALDRAQTRGVDPNAVDYTLRRLVKIQQKLSWIKPGKQFWIYDWSREIALGMRKLSKDELIFQLKTVWPGRPSPTPDVTRIIQLR